MSLFDHLITNEQRLEQTMPNGPSPKAKLLVSVRSVAEAEEALAGGVDIVDIKEPNHGALGAASPDVISIIVELVAGRRPVTVAMGELGPETPRQIALLTQTIPVAAVKVGLAGQRSEPWREALAQLAQQMPNGTDLVAVAYADHEAADAPTPEEVLEQATQLGLKAYLLDTFDKRHEPDKKPRGVFDALPADRLSNLFQAIRQQEMLGVLAGSIREDQLKQVISVQPAVVGVRGAVCNGGRNGAVTQANVAAFRKALQGR